MANPNAPYGFKPLRHLTGGVIKMNEYELANASATSIFLNDVVILLTTGLIDRATAASVPVIGVFAGCEYVLPDGSIQFNKMWTGGTVTKTGQKVRAWVYDDPRITFKCQCSGATAFTKDMVGSNNNMVATAGDTSVGMSKEDLDITTPVTTTSMFRILRFLDTFPGNALGANAQVEVAFTQHLNLAVTGI